MKLKYQDKHKLIHKLKEDIEWLAFLNDQDDSAFVAFLLNKYGPVPADYIVGNAPNKAIKRKNEGLEIHHIHENQIADLSHSQYWNTEHQHKEFLVYANYNEHAVLHYLIGKQQNGLGLGGLYNHGLLLRCQTYMSPAHYKHFKSLADTLKEHTEKKILATQGLDLAAKINEALKEIEEKRKKQQAFCQELPEGVNILEPQDYYDNIAESQKILQYSCVYAIRYHDLYAFCTINKKQETILWYQKQPHKIKYNPQFIYDNLSYIYTKQEAFRQTLHSMSDGIKSCYKAQMIWLNGIALYYGLGVSAQQIAFFDTLKHALIMPTDANQTLVTELFQDSNSLPLIYDDKLFLYYKQINKDFIKITNSSNILYSLEDPELLYSTN